MAAGLAARIAEVASPNFLIAGLIARTHGLHDAEAVPPATIVGDPTVDSALADYLTRIADLGGTPSTDVLTALAYSQSPGLTLELWNIALQALTGQSVPPDTLRGFARGSAANFLVESTTNGATYRLFHQALNDTLLTRRADTHDSTSDQQALTRAFLLYGRDVGWDDAPIYLLNALPHHAAQADMIDDLLHDADYLLYANLRRLIPTTGQAHTTHGHACARVLKLTPAAIDATPAERTSLFSLTEALDNLGRTYRDHPMPSLYRAQWAHSNPRTEITALVGHTGGVRGVCAVTVDGRQLLASAGSHGTVRVWDPGTGEQLLALAGPSWIS